jgi:hypothetical protein
MSAAFREQLEPAFAGNDDLRTYVDEVLRPTLDFALAITLQEALTWSRSTRKAKAVAEAMSAVLLKLLGRSLVAVADTAAAHVQEQMQDLMLHAADVAANPNGLVSVLTNNPAVTLVADDIAELVSDALHVAADVFGPLPPERRARIRGLLYDVLDPARGAPPDQLVQALENPGLIPNEGALRDLATELGNLATERFVLFVQGLVSRILQRMADAWLAALETALAVAGQFIADLTHAIGLIVQRLEEIGHEIQALADHIADAIAGAMGDLDALLDSFSSSTGRNRFVNQLASSVSSTALGVLEHDWAYKNLVPGDIRHKVRDAVRDVVRDLLEGAPLDAFLAAIGAVRDQVTDIIDDARNLDRSKPLSPQVADLIIARLSGLVADRYGTIRIRVAFGFHWDTFLGRVDQDFDLGHVTVHVGDVAAGIRPIVQELGAFEAAIDSLAGRIKDILDAESASTDLATEHEAVKSEHERLSGIAAEQQSGPKTVVIERPVQMQTTSADTPCVIRLEGFASSILEADEHIPQRLFVLLNGQPIELDSFRVEAAMQPVAPPLGAGVAPLSTDARYGAIAATARQRNRNAAHAQSVRSPGSRMSLTSRATIGSRVQMPREFGGLGPLPPSVGIQTPGVRISGHVPIASLIEGLNSLMVTAVTGPGQHVSDTVGFHLSSVPAKRDPGFPLPPAQRGLKGLPKATPLAPGRTIMVQSDRKLAARKLERRMKPAPIHPLVKLAAHSPVLAQRAGISHVPPAQVPGVLRVSKGRRVVP